MISSLKYARSVGRGFAVWSMAADILTTQEYCCSANCFPRQLLCLRPLRSFPLTFSHSIREVKMIRYFNSNRTLLVLVLMLVALLFSGSGKSNAKVLLSCQEQCEQQYNQCRSLGIDYYTCTQQRNYCLYHCG